ncbi:hypothetical protein [Haloglomus salinum]|uniref:hypothetical protein n=1 Tax=Haloglomus salinum TaxID=2962673 RepID=UPI0020C953A9|nr:hypothetical protein [Haloglomus salinum]
MDEPILKYAYQDLPPLQQEIWRKAEEEFGVNEVIWRPEDIELPANLLSEAAERIDALEEVEPGQYLVTSSRFVDRD